MISIVEHSPPDPSSSNYQNHHQQQEVSHEAFASVSDIDLLKNSDAANLDDTNNQLPNFSIRDYVYGSRCKDIACNWPFSRKSLQICLLHGVLNFLPPFQSLDALRTNCVDESPLLNEVSVSCFDGKSTNGQCHIEEDLAYTKSSKSTPASQKTVKKCKFFVKLNSGVALVQEVNPNNFIVSETMASKVCPVCKTLLSSSNTTLNAHIDRCLSEESSMKRTANQKITVKHRIKPRTTRLMVDIYKTAPHCPIEELDRRNGTSWATNSSFPDQELEFQAEVEMTEKPQEPTFIPEVADREGAVYIDTNGKKVRILSMPTFRKLDDREARKLQKRGKVSRFIAGKKKKKSYVQKVSRKILKLSTNSKKMFDKRATSGQEENVGVEDSCNKDGSDKPMKAQVSTEMDHLAITRPPWACSKRTGLAKKRFPALTNPKEGVDPSIIGSKESKFSSLKKNLSKFNLKRKFSALKKSRDHCLSMEFKVTVPSQNSLEKKSRMEEYTEGNLSSEMVSVLEVEKRKSNTSKSSQGGSSGGAEITSECVRTVVPFQGSFTGLRNSLDDEFSDLYQGQLISPTRTLDDVKKIRINHNTEDLINTIKRDGDYFVEVDSIPIPGPPGSFLPPSPGADMVSEEELQGNSSLTTTSRVQSSEDQHHHDMMNHEFISDSPISTISSPSFARSSEKLSLDKKYMNTSDLRPFDVICTEKGPYPTALNHQKSRERDLELNRRANSINFRSDLFPVTLSPPETVKSSADASVKLPVYRDCESVSPTTPVLRLMGKNLTVVKTDDDQFRPPPSLSPLSHLIKNENHNAFFYGHPPQHHIDFSQNQNGSVPQYSNLYPPNNLTNLSQSRPVHKLHTIFPSTRNGLMAPANCQSLDTRVAHDNSTKELIVVDDSSENEGDDHMLKIQMRRNLASSSSFTPMHKSQNFANYPYGNLGRWVLPSIPPMEITGSPLPSILPMGSSTAYQEHMKFQVYR